MIKLLIGFIIALVVVSIVLWVVAGIAEDRIDKEHFESEMEYSEKAFDLDEKDNGFFDK